MGNKTITTCVAHLITVIVKIKNKCHTVNYGKENENSIARNTTTDCTLWFYHKQAKGEKKKICVIIIFYLAFSILPSKLSYNIYYSVIGYDLA